ncbi:FRG domain-containing protein [Klenkia brasiliensis]|uniref:FRG domain-containing protein n=1 Tax=Klenkia brasiliensis TaxID=333142 RepID=A0A1G7WW08_9ACTN|nr:FRG domain-containing protein [Klenkia brasiliensis]SDG76115.1 FRG domain-containing protein [Klenkia brasiliensis]
MAEQADPQWVRSGWGHRVESQDEAYRAVMRIVSLAPHRRYVWRGCTSSRLRVRSGLLRELVVDEADPLPDELLVRQNELAILRAARAWGPGTGPAATDLDLLAHLQQHGLPTRLLDVTDNPMTGLWFACEGGDDVSGVLLALDVTGLPTYPTTDPRQGSGGPAEPPARSLRQALRRSALDARPFLVRPAVPSARMAAQEGLFLSGVVPAFAPQCGVDGLPLRLGTPPGREKLAVLFGERQRRAGRPTRLPLCALVVPPGLKATIRNHLTALNRRRSVLYPDVEGFRDAYRGDHVDLDLDAVRPVVSAHDDVDAGEP